LRSLLGDIITVWAGRDTAAKKFYINTDLAVQHSEFFKAVLENGSKESEEHTVRLPDLSEYVAAAFEGFQSFLSIGKFVWDQEEAVEDSEYDDEHEQDVWDLFVDSWILGNALQSGSFKDAVADAVVRKLSLAQSIPMDVYVDIYQNSSESSPIRKLMVDIVVHKWLAEEIAEVRIDNDPVVQAEFLRDVAVALFKVKHLSQTQQAGTPFSGGSSCRYHEHGAEKPCYKTMFG
jgi:hypothetical protein